MVTRAKTLKEKPENVNNVRRFGEGFTDHMLTIDWSKQAGWDKPHIQPYGPIELATSATSLHYGMSAYMTLGVYENAKTHKLQSFRLREHLDHFLESTLHLDLPPFDCDQLS